MSAKEAIIFCWFGGWWIYVSVICDLGIFFSMMVFLSLVGVVDSHDTVGTIVVGVASSAISKSEVNKRANLK